MKTTGTILAATAAAVVAVIGATGAAQAKGKTHIHIGIGGGHFHKHHFHRRHVFIGGPIYSGCGYEKHMWWKTGSYYWKKEYYLCKGWW